MPSILHVDMDAFYASIEQRDHPLLRGKPVVVGGPSLRRGVVAAASYEARKYGIRSAMPAAQASRLCPDLILIRADFDKYIAESRRIMAILRSFTPLVEPLSLDEAFLDVAGSERLFGSPLEIAWKIKERVRAETGLVASVGVAPTKFLAKLASDLKKPDGLFVIHEGEVGKVLGPLPVDKIFGVGKKTTPKLEKLGIRTIGELAAHPRADLVAQFGAFGEWMHDLARGIDPRPVVPERVEKSKGMERTFEEDTLDLESLRRKLLEFSEEVAFDLRASALRGRTVSIKVRFSDFRTVTRSRTLDFPTNLGPRIYTVARDLLERTELAKPVRLLGVSLSNLEDVRGPIQLELFGERPGPPEEEKGRKLAAGVDRVRRRFGKKALQPAALLSPRRPGR